MKWVVNDFFGWVYFDDFFEVYYCYLVGEVFCSWYIVCDVEVGDVSFFFEFFYEFKNFCMDWNVEYWDWFICNDKGWI